MRGLLRVGVTLLPVNTPMGERLHATGHGKRVRTPPPSPRSRLREHRSARHAPRHRGAGPGLSTLKLRAPSPTDRTSFIDETGRPGARQHSCVKGRASCWVDGCCQNSWSRRRQHSGLGRRYGRRRGSHRRSRAACTRGIDGRRDEDVNDARPQRARPHAGKEHIANTRRWACVKPPNRPTATRQRRGVLDIGPRWRGHRYTMYTAAA